MYRQIQRVPIAKWRDYLPVPLQTKVLEEMRYINILDKTTTKTETETYSPTPGGELAEVGGLQESTAARRLLQLLKTDSCIIGEDFNVVQVIRDVTVDMNPTTSQQRMSRLMLSMVNCDHLNWLAVDVINAINCGRRDSENILVSPLSLSALLLMAQMACPSGTTSRYQIEDLCHNIDEYRLDQCDILDDVFTSSNSNKLNKEESTSTGSWYFQDHLQVTLAHSLWLPKRFSNAYGDMVNRYLSGHIGAFRSGRYHPPPPRTLEKKGAKGEENKNSAGENRVNKLAIDEWINRTSKGQVSQIFGSSLYNVSGLLVGVASYKCAWRYQFSADNGAQSEVRDETDPKYPMPPSPRVRQFPTGWFQVDSSHRMKCRFMVLKHVQIPYTTSNDALIVNVDFASNGFQALIAIPRFKKRLKAISKNIKHNHRFKNGGNGGVKPAPLWNDLYDPPSLEAILLEAEQREQHKDSRRKRRGSQFNKSEKNNNKNSANNSETTTTPLLKSVVRRMHDNVRKGKYVTKLTLPMGKIQWTGNLKDILREKYGIKDIFEEYNATLDVAEGTKSSDAHISGVIQRCELELIPEGVETPVNRDMERKKQRHLEVDCPFLIVIHKEGQAILAGHIRSVSSPGVDTSIDEITHDPWESLKGKMEEFDDLDDEDLEDLAT